MNRNTLALRLIAALLLAPAAAFCASMGGSIQLNRLVTPNGDGKNDTFIFRCYNPKDEAVEGKIFTVAGTEVANMRLKQRSTGVPATAYVYGEFYDMEWDPNDGAKKPGGVYVYQVRLGTSVYKGTVAVIR